MHWTSYALPVIGMTLGFCCAFNCCRFWISKEGCYDDASQRYMFWVNLGGVSLGGAVFLWAAWSLIRVVLMSR
jgi:uncharacterized membrane protein